MSDDLELLAARVARLEDERDIRDLMARYAHCIDHHRADEWVDCFTPEGRFEVRRPGAEARVITGRDELSGFAGARPDEGVPTKHFTSQIVIDMDGDTATGRCYFALLSDVGGDPTLFFYGRYLDEIVRGGDGCWRFASRIAAGESRRRQAGVVPQTSIKTS